MTRKLLLAILLFVAGIAARAQTKESDALFAQGVSLYNKGKYKDAIKVFARCDSIDALTLPAESSRAWYGKVWMGACYHKLGDDAKAKELSPYYTAPPVDRRLTVQSDSLSDLVMPMYQEGKATESAPILKRVMELERENLGENSVWCANTMMLYANALAHSTGDFNEARTYVDKALAVFKVYRMHDSYIQANDLLYGWYLDTGDYATAKTILTVSRDLRVANNYPELEIAVDNATIAECDVFTGKPREGLDSIAAIAARCVDQLDMGKESYLYGRWTYAMASANYALGNQQEAYDKATEAKRILENNGDNYSFAHFQNDLCMALSALNLKKDNATELIRQTKDNYLNSEFALTPSFISLLDIYYHNAYKSMTKEERVETMEKQLSLAGQVYGKNSVFYLSTLTRTINHQMDFPDDEAMMAKAYAYIKEAEGIINGMDSVPTHIIADVYQKKSIIDAGYYNKADEAEKDLLEALPIMERHGGKDRAYYSIVAELAKLCQNSGRYEEAFNHYAKIEAFYEKTGDTANESYLKTLLNIIQYCQSVGDASKMEAYTQKVDNVVEGAENLRNTYTYLALLVSKSMMSLQKGNMEESNRMTDEALAISKKINMGAEAEDAWIFLPIMGNHFMSGNYAKAENMMKEILTSFQKVVGKTTTDMLVAKGWMARIYMLEGKYAEAKGIMDEVMTELPNYTLEPKNKANILYINSDLNIRLKNYKEGIAGTKQLNTLLADIVRNNFSWMSYRQRTTFWDEFSSWYQYDFPQFFYRFPNDEVSGFAYDNALLSKGLLLNSETAINKFVSECKDKQVLNLYNEIKADKARLDRMTQAGQTGSEYSALAAETEGKERRLLSMSKAYGDYTKRLAVGWADVRRSLKPDEAAIELMSIPLNADSTMLSALVLRHDSKVPRRVDLCAERQISAIGQDSLYSTDRLYHLVWKPLESALQGATRVYFSPAGMLHSVAIEYAPDGRGTLAAERFNLCRLSSTREIAMEQTRPDKEQATLYGGLEYDTDAETLKEVNQAYATDAYRSRALTDDRSMRAGVMPLEGTEKEVRNIAAIMKDAKERYKVYSSCEGTEESFKALSGTDNTCLHIATHGFYIPDKGGNGRARQTFSFMVNDNSIPEEDRAMTHSGLLFAGANATLHNETLPYNLEDGILTSQEITSLDFRKVDLVVLSACQTALGDMTGDGVFGLQRGFKKAGAKTLLMSLWKVDDTATQILMTRFYTNYLSGDTKGQKRASFVKAQQYLRACDGGKYDNPVYWAAFIMLDALS